MEIAIAAAIALASGGLLGWWLRGLVFRSVASAHQVRIGELERQRDDRAKELEELKASHGREQAKLVAALQSQAAAEALVQRIPELESQLAEAVRVQVENATKVAEAEAALRNERNAAAEKINLLTQAQSSLSDAFKALSSEALKSNNQTFMDLARTTLEKFQEGARTDLESRQKAVDALVKPIQDSLQKVDGKLGEIEKSRLQSYAALDEQLKGLLNNHLPTLHRETANLVKALRQPTVRGRWGEIQLQRVVEMAGMLEHCDFTQQDSLSTEEGRLRPDLTVRLPGGKCVVVDAKAPVSAYLDAIETEDESARSLLLADHARQVRTHISQLGRKAYWDQLDQTPEFVILFLPGEMFFSAALQQDSTLIEFGVNEKVIPATPTTLIALLRAVSYGWRQEALAENAQAISDLGRELFKRISDLAGHWSDVGKHLGKSLDAFNKATGTLESRVLVSARRFKDLKAAPDGVELETLELVDRAPRELQAGELTGREKVGSGEN